MNGPRRILVIRLSALGDVLLATPAVRALARHFPEARVDWLIESVYLSLVEGNPWARPIAYEKRGRHAGAAGLLKLRRELAANDYDLVVDLQGKPKTWLLRGIAPSSIGFRKRTAGQAALALFGRDPPMKSGHAIDLFLKALAPLGVDADGRGLDLAITERMRREADEALPGGRDLVGLAPGTRWETKRWPAERFAALAGELRDSGFEPVLIGGPSDRDAIDAVRAAVPGGGEAIRDTMGLSVGGLAALIGRCRLVVAGDSGPVHIASAVGTPVVAVFGPTSPERWRPLSEGSDVVRFPVECSPCSNHGTLSCPKGHHDCMRRLEVEPVLAAARRALERGGGSPAGEA